MIKQKRKTAKRKCNSFNTICKCASVCLVLTGCLHCFCFFMFKKFVALDFDYILNWKMKTKTKKHTEIKITLLHRGG